MTHKNAIYINKTLKKIEMDLKPENNFIDLTRAARAKRLHAMAKVEEHDKTMVDFKTSHPDDYVVKLIQISGP